MAIQTGGTTRIGNTGQLQNISSVDATTVATLNAGGVGGGSYYPTYNRVHFGTGAYTTTAGAISYLALFATTDTTSLTMTLTVSGTLTSYRYWTIGNAPTASTYYGVSSVAATVRGDGGSNNGYNRPVVYFEVKGGSNITFTPSGTNSQYITYAVYTVV
tara:strand:- start:342 stop:818 length:477 start_codon:yes stop_codon:yes gene_type:complete